MKSVKDWRGNPIRIGSRVIWPSRQGSNLWMNEGVVEAITPIEPKYRDAPDYKIGVRRIREQTVSGRSTAVVNRGLVYPSVDRLTANCETSSRSLQSRSSRPSPRVCDSSNA